MTEISDATLDPEFEVKYRMRWRELIRVDKEFRMNRFVLCRRFLFILGYSLPSGGGGSIRTSTRLLYKNGMVIQLTINNR